MKKIIVILLLVNICYGVNGITNNINKTYTISDIEGTWEKKLETRQDNSFFLKVKFITTYESAGNYSSKDSYTYYDLNNTFIASYNIDMIGEWSITKKQSLKTTSKQCSSKLIEKNNSKKVLFKKIDMFNKIMCMFHPPISTKIIEISSDKIVTEEGISLRIK